MGFKKAAASIAKKQGIPVKNAGAILAAGARKASAKAKEMNPNLKKVFAKGAEGDNGYAFDDVQNIISTLSGKPVTSSYTVDKDKYNKTNITRNLWDVGNSGYAHKIMGYLRRAGLGQ